MPGPRRKKSQRFTASCTAPPSLEIAPFKISSLENRFISIASTASFVFAAHRMTLASNSYCSKKRRVADVADVLRAKAAVEEDGFLRGGGGLREGGQGGGTEREAGGLEEGAAGGHGGYVRRNKR